jgi:hypothetical protein
MRLKNGVSKLIAFDHTKYANIIIDPDKYLPPATWNWTNSQLLELDFDARNPPDHSGGDVFSPHRTIYLELRARINSHIDQELEPILSLSTRPREGFNWQPLLGVQEAEVAYDYFEDRQF